ncbi:GNAT family N-acetyltransferase [Nitrogeniibacter mangrovi]|uniref:GNAT family N-acetyltransferase n=1 Tax=Nitrogeniibacter mangrovi TaxID=2016596 RepID=A0A6C1B2Y8_9RHOO|nr:GNAT family N-acetyltransferase [Nitrogeniibacter mangrovi]QID17349.1 GNAT family N-acetyltransferase [Nitrogeniibacter mangrovi]
MNSESKWPVVVAELNRSADLRDFIAGLAVDDIRARFNASLLPEVLPGMLAPAPSSGFINLGAWKQGRLVGTAVLAHEEDDRYELAVLVRSNMKRRGIGTALTLEALRNAARLDAGRVVAHVRASNTAALALLSATGFRRISALGFEMMFGRWPAATANGC